MISRSRLRQYHVTSLHQPRRTPGCVRLASVGVYIALGVSLSLSLSSPVFAESTWRDPHPQRLDGFIDGREFSYNAESFLHRLSYRQLTPGPIVGRDGLYGSGGSITGDQLYLEANLQKSLWFDNDVYGVVGRMMRREDFDGRYDRQMLGVARRFGSDWQGRLMADITGDKGRVDFQLEADWNPDSAHSLRTAVVMTDRLYNNKSDSDNKYFSTPLTLFAHYQWVASGYTADLALNVSPQARYLDRVLNREVESEQVRVAASFSAPMGEALRTGLDIKVEQTDRNHTQLSSSGSLSEVPFQRRTQQVSWTLANEASARQWHGGAMYFRFREDGWFGEAFATGGHHWRDEAYVFAGARLGVSDTSWWEPTLYAGNVDMDRQWTQRPEYNRTEERWVVKLSAAWRYVVNQQSGAVLTLNPTFRLHSLGFGGGNIQLHWPLYPATARRAKDARQ